MFIHDTSLRGGGNRKIDVNLAQKRYGKRFRFYAGGRTATISQRRRIDTGAQRRADLENGIREKTESIRSAEAELNEVRQSISRAKEMVNEWGDSDAVASLKAYQRQEKELQRQIRNNRTDIKNQQKELNELRG